MKQRITILAARRRIVLSVWMAGLIGIGVSASATATAAVKLPALISDNMVLQQDRPVGISGTADPGEVVTVSIAQQDRTVTADANGQWRVELAPLKPGGPFDMTVAGKNTVQVRNILVGEVWVAAGQSNMAMAVQGRPGTSEGVINADREIAAANYPHLRLFKVQIAVAGKPQPNVQGRWVAASPATVGAFSAVGYFFGRDLQRSLKIPVGIIESSRGGTQAEAWMSEEVLQADPDLKMQADSWRRYSAGFPRALEAYIEQLRAWEQSAEQAEAAENPVPAMPRAPEDPRSHRWRASGLWNAMIAPLVSYAMRGVLWYQGESNTDSPYQYREVFARLISDWRRAWGEKDFPFLFVQLPNFAEGPEDSWAVLRESQAKALALPNVGMAVAIDIGESHNIHPRNKQEVGRRLVLTAEAVAYGKRQEHMGPMFQSLRSERGTVRLRFSHEGNGLVARGRILTGFQIAGPDQKFIGARAHIVGNSVVLSNPRVKQPVAARYAWANDPRCNLYSKSGLPAPPFRTDDWKVPGQGEVRRGAPKFW